MIKFWWKVIERDDGSIRNIWIFILPLGREQNFNIEQTYSSMKQRFANLFIFSKFEILLNFFLEKRRKINLDIYIYNNRVRIYVKKIWR